MKLYTLAPSHPAKTARMMLDLKGIEHEVVRFEPGFQPVMLRLHGFRGATVPALRYGDRRIQGSTQISRFLDSVEPEPPLFGTDPEQRAAVEEAERWGEAEYQSVARRIFRWSLNRDNSLRLQLAEDSGLPLPEVSARISKPMAAYFAKIADADDEHVRADVAGLPAHIDRIDALIDAGTLGGGAPNAADLQIAPSTRVLMHFPQLASLIEGRLAAEHAMRFCADFGRETAAEIPPEWLPA